MKFYLHHIYLLLAIVALVVCMCSPALITFVYNDMSMVSMTNFALRYMCIGRVAYCVGIGWCLHHVCQPVSEFLLAEA